MTFSPAIVAKQVKDWLGRWGLSVSSVSIVLQGFNELGAFVNCIAECLKVFHSVVHGFESRTCRSLVSTVNMETPVPISYTEVSPE